MSYRDIRGHVEDMYGINVSEVTISGVTDSLIPKLQEWQQRPLDKLYPFVWLDAIHYKVREDILITCVDGLTGFPEAIASILPQTEVQLCVIHQIRNSLKYVASKHQKEFMRDLKPIYRAVSKQAAEVELDKLEQKWGKQYPAVLRSWHNKWDNLSAYFKYTAELCKIIYTTNAVGAVHRQFRKLTKTKGAFPNENSLLKLLYAGILNASKKWTMPVHNWGSTICQLAIHFDGRVDDFIDI